LSQISDESEIGGIVKKVLSENKKAVEDYKKGKENALKFLVGQAMAATKGRAEPERLNKILKKAIGQL
jgi:aspartyl-tRNA(Asn)/glutamyl-tRNA(Gln) amidotransferase subunit B